MFEFLHRLFSGKAIPSHTRIRPVGDALDVTPGQFGQPMRVAISAINRVHQDGTLPVILVTRDFFRDRHGQFSVRAGRIAIQINLVGPHAELTTVHEIGHFLDHSGWGKLGGWASETPGVLDQWRDAVKRSRGIQRLLPLLQTGVDRTSETLPDGTVVEYEVDQAYLRYLLQPRELWACSYAQFIAVQSGDSNLLLQLDSLRDKPVRTFYYGEQWDKDDFRPIQLSIEAVFRSLRWM